MEHRLVTIATFNLPTEVALLRSRLESEGIECILDNELTIQTDPLFSAALGGVRLRVWEQDVEAARLILEENGIDILAEVRPTILERAAESIADKLPFLNGKNPFVKLAVLFGLAAFIVLLILAKITLSISQ